jgi:multidrug resistance efflux pump
VNRKKIIIGVLIVLLATALVGANLYFKRDTGLSVQVEKIQKRNLESIVSASGKVRARTTVNISANTMGRVTKLAVEEGARVKAGQFLMEIDPRQLRTQVERGVPGHLMRDARGIGAQVAGGVNRGGQPGGFIRALILQRHPGRIAFPVPQADVHPGHVRARVRDG